MAVMQPSTRPKAGPATDAKWRWRHLVLAPHRLGFFLAMGVLVSAGLWWALVLVDRSLWPLGFSWAVSPTLLHGSVMVFGFIPLFFAGFLFTAGPRWLGVQPLAADALVRPLVMQTAGWLIWLAGGHLHLWLSVAGLLLALAGLGQMVLKFDRLVKASKSEDRLHATAILWAARVGCLSLAGSALALALNAHDLAIAFVLTGLWGFVVVTYVTVAHRMIPFFTSSAVPMVSTWRPFWVLWALLGAAIFQVVAVWVEWRSLPGGLLGQVWTVMRGLVELTAGGVVIWLAVAWGLVQSLKIRLLAMLHIGFVWLGLALLLSGATQWIGLVAGQPVLSLGALHALTMGCLGSLMLAMVTRVSCGHSGRALVADNFVWGLFWLLQLATVLRIAGAVQVVPGGVIAAAALLWAGVMLLWGWRHMGWYGRLRIDGKPG